MKTPNLGDAHCGLGAPQSQHVLLLFSFWIAASLDLVSGSTSHMALEAIAGNQLLISVLSPDNLYFVVWLNVCVCRQARDSVAVVELGV